VGFLGCGGFNVGLSVVGEGRCWWGGGVFWGVKFCCGCVGERVGCWGGVCGLEGFGVFVGGVGGRRGCRGSLGGILGVGMRCFVGKCVGGGGVSILFWGGVGGCFGGWEVGWSWGPRGSAEDVGTSKNQSVT